MSSYKLFKQYRRPLSLCTCWSPYLQHSFMSSVCLNVTRWCLHWPLRNIILCIYLFVVHNENVNSEKGGWGVDGPGWFQFFSMLYPQFQEHCLAHIRGILVLVQWMHYWQTNKINAFQKSFRKYYWNTNSWTSCI